MSKEAIFYLCVYIVEGITAWQYFRGLFKIKRPLWVTLLSTVVIYGGFFLLFDVSRIWLNSLFFLLGNFILLAFFFFCSLKASIFHSAILTCLMLATETLVEFLLGMMFGGTDGYQNNMTFLVIFGVLSKLLLYLSTKICLQFAREQGHLGSDIGPTALLFGSFSIAAILVLVLMAQIVIAVDLPPQIETFMMVASCVLLLANILIYFGYQQNQKLNKEYLSLQLVRQKDEAEEHYFKAIEQHYDQQRVLLHDIRRHLTMIKELALDSKDSKVVEYVTSIEKVPALQNKVKYCDNSMLNVVLSRYAEICREKGISFQVDVRDKSYDFLSPNDITSLFGNLLENAVEAAQGAPEPYIELRVDTQPGAALFVSLTNSCGSPPQSDGLGGFLTRKRNREQHGMGLKSVRMAVENYDGTFMPRYDEQTGLFHAMIAIKKK